MVHTTCTQGNEGNSRLLVVGIKLPIWFPTLHLAITYVLNTQMGHASPFYTSMFHELFNDVKNFFNSMSFDPCNRPLKIRDSIGCLLGLQLPKCELTWELWGFIPSHSPTLLGAWNVTPRLTFGSHLCKFFCLNHKLKVRITIITLKPNKICSCSCVDFSFMMASSFGKWGLWVPCKHLYYIL